MIHTTTTPHLGASTAVVDLGRFETSDRARPERFADFSGFHAAGVIGLGQAVASVDPAHAARHVAGFLLEG